MRLAGRTAVAFAGIGISVLLWGQTAPAPSNSEFTTITAESLREDVAYLASDALEGRATPSPGLDEAANFLAGRFRAAGLEPIGPGGSYFQEARFGQVTPSLEKLAVRLVAGNQQIQLEADTTSVRSLTAIDLTDEPLIGLPDNGELPRTMGKVVAGSAAVYGSEAGLQRLQAQHPKLILLVARRKGRSVPSFLEDLDAGLAPVIRVGNEETLNALASAQTLKLSVHVEAPKMEVLKLRNVGGVLRGSDPALREQFVMLTAHYDHIGKKPGGGDQIFNGANDNASGTASVVEIAKALATLPTKPKRSILFLALFGEEKGLLGAYYYTRHPLFPLARTVAEVNLEQMGRTDDKEGARLREISFTGPSYSDLPATVAEAAKAEGVSVYKKSDADEFFPRSDNYAFALAGIVAHTLVVAYEYDGYHAPDDEWQKLDYQNMALVDKGVAAGILRIANRAELPKWSETKSAEAYKAAAGQ